MKDLNFYQIFITGTGKYLTELLSRGLGGVIFFSKDITSESEFKNFVLNVKKQAFIPPFISIDQEGGRVERTENIYPRRLPMKQAYALGEDYLKKQTQEMAEELQNLGFNLNFAPVADVNTNPNNPIIGERAFGNNPEDVIKGVKIVSECYLQNKIIPCVKHYPGHGDAAQDSHKTLPKIDLDLETMEKYHLPPFRFAVNNGIPMIMIAHLDCNCFNESGIPTSLSHNAIQFLRKNIGFKGIIISDDMNMGGVNYLPPLEAAIKAIKAGVDILLYRNSDEETFNIICELEKIANKDNELKIAITNSIQRIMSLKQSSGLIQ